MKNITIWEDFDNLNESEVTPLLTQAQMTEYHNYEGNPKNPEVLAIEDDDIRSAILLIAKQKKDPLKAMLLYKDIISVHPEWQIGSIKSEDKHRWPNPDRIRLMKLIVRITSKR